MEKQTITAAPQVNVDALYEQWLETHTGTKDDFIRFMSTPGVLRADFLLDKEPVVSITEGVGTATYGA